MRRVRRIDTVVNDGRWRCRLLVMSLLCLALIQQVASAVPEHKVTVLPGVHVGGYGGTTSADMPVQLIGSGSGVNPPNSVNANWSVRSDRGSLDASVSKDAFGNAFPSADTTQAVAEYTIDDLVFTGVGGNISTSLFLDLNGMFLFDDGEGAFGHGRLETFIFGPGGNYGFTGDTGPGGSLGLLAGWTYPSSTIGWGIPSVALNVPNTLTVRLIAQATAGDGAFGDGMATAWSDFMVTFHTDGPVFNLPPGVTADSPQGGIVDNRYIGPASPPSGVVPEPTSLLLIVLGLGAAGCRKRRPCGRVLTK